MKQQVVALKMHSGKVTLAGAHNTVHEVKMKRPPGCTGILFCFESKKAARAYWGQDVELVRFLFEKEEVTK